MEKCIYIGNIVSMWLYLLYGEDVPHRDSAPFKTYLTLARDEDQARDLAPAGFRIDLVEKGRAAENRGSKPALLGWWGE